MLTVEQVKRLFQDADLNNPDLEESSAAHAKLTELGLISEDGTFTEKMFKEFPEVAENLC